MYILMVCVCVCNGAAVRLDASLYFTHYASYTTFRRRCTKNKEHNQEKNARHLLFFKHKRACASVQVHNIREAPSPNREV